VIPRYSKASMSSASSMSNSDLNMAAVSKIILSGCAPHFSFSRQKFSSHRSQLFMILQPGFINDVAPMIDARSILKSWRKRPTVSLPKTTMAKTVRVQVPDVLPLGKSLKVAVGTRLRGRPKPKVGGRSFCWENRNGFQVGDIQTMRMMPPLFAFRTIHGKGDGSPSSTKHSSPARFSALSFPLPFTASDHLIPQ
jgi:hypothetical protein